MNLAIIGATGNVGRKIIEVLEKSSIEVKNLFLVASEKSAGKKLFFKKKEILVEQLENYDFSKAKITIFAAGSEIAKEWVPKASKKSIIIDNSKYFRMEKDVPLVVAEVNPNELQKHKNIIANPNCSTIQLLMVLAPLHKNLKIKRVIVSTYQAVSGSGKKAVEQLQNEEMNVEGKMAYPHNIYRNVIPHCDDFLNNGYTKEEMKITNETKKILDKNIDVVATAARVPVIEGHSESVNITFSHGFDLKKIKDILENTPGVKVLDNISKNVYPMPINSYKKNEVFVGRIRKDFTLDKTLNLWITADNLRKGAATNAVQIAEYLINKNIL